MQNTAFARSIIVSAIALAFSPPSSAITIDLSNVAGFESFQQGDSNITTVTGIRDRNITGNYSITGSGGNTGGLLFQSTLSNVTQVPFPTYTSNGSNFPGAISSTPYGPSFGSTSGILRVVGSYKTATSGSGATGDLGYLVDGVTGTTTQLLPTSLAGGNPILNTIAHSTFGNTVVGNYDTQLITGNSFVYDIPSGTYSSVPFVGKSFDSGKQITSVASNTAYGVYNNLISGGYTGTYNSSTGTYAYIYNKSNDKVYTFSSPDLSLVTHFEGITSAGKPGVYNLVADAVDGQGNHVKAYVATVDLNTIDLTTGQPTITWTEIKVVSNLTSANSMYQGKVIGVYVNSTGQTIAYQADIGSINYAGVNTPIYDPKKNSTASTTTLLGAGWDVINNSTITVANGNGIESGSACGYAGCSTTEYGGVITNNGTVSVSGGSGNSGVLMQGTFGTLLNYGTLRATDSNYAIQTTGSGVSAADGSLIVNTSSGIIDGQVYINAGPYARFENSGSLGITSAGSGVTHTISGTFVQTSTGTLGLRVSPSAADKLQVNGTAYLGGVLNVTATGSYRLGQRIALVNGTGGVNGQFSSLTTNLQNVSYIDYDSTNAYWVYGPSPVYTLQSVQQNAQGLSSVINQQVAALQAGLSYDCNQYNEHNLCISVGGRYTYAGSGPSGNAQSGLVIVGYRPMNTLRVGGFADQSASIASPSGISQSKTSPMWGIFGNWNLNKNGNGLGVQASAAFASSQLSITRTATAYSEAGQGNTQFGGQAYQAQVNYAQPVDDKLKLIPYIGLRYTQINNGAYTENSSATVIAPLSYNATAQNTFSAVGGLGVSAWLAEKLKGTASVGIQQNLNYSMGNYQGTSAIPGLTSFSVAMPGNVNSMATASAGIYYDVRKNERIGMNVLWQQQPFIATNTTTALATYSIGF